MNEFIIHLQTKLNSKKAAYNKNELDWLIQHIGYTSSKIRDDLVCNTLGYGFIEEKFTIDQAKYLLDQIKKYELLFYKIDEIGIPTLTKVIYLFIIAVNYARK